MVAMAQALSHGHMMIAWTILLASYFVFAVGRLPGTKIDRPAMAVIGAVLMFVFRVLAPAQAIASIDFATPAIRPALPECRFVARFLGKKKGRRQRPSSLHEHCAAVATRRMASRRRYLFPSGQCWPWSVVRHRNRRRKS